MAEQAAAEALKIARELDGVVKKINVRLGTTATYAKRTRRLALVLTVSIVVDILFSIFVGFVLVHEHDTQSAIRQSQLHACQIGNDARAGQRKLWDHLFSVSKPPPGETPAQRAERLKEIAQFRAYVHRLFTPVDCAKLYRR